MKCPFCQREMKKGLVTGRADPLGRGVLSWTDHEDTQELLWLKDRSKSIYLSGRTKGGYRGVTAYKCSSCKKIIMDTYIEEDENGYDRTF